MRFNDQDADLRMLSLLHAMGDRQGFIEEVRKLKESQSLDESTWQQVCDMGRELKVSLVGHDCSSGHEHDNLDRDGPNRRVQIRRSGVDRRNQGRRTAEIIWLGQERREVHRRRQVRREGDLIGVY